VTASASVENSHGAWDFWSARLFKWIATLSHEDCEFGVIGCNSVQAAGSFGKQLGAA
jgi:hypothetical protein